jgi:hypothetical protein
MAVIQKNFPLSGSVGQRDELALFDSGATYSCIAPGLTRQINVSREQGGASAALPEKPRSARGFSFDNRPSFEYIFFGRIAS